MFKCTVGDPDGCRDRRHKEEYRRVKCVSMIFLLVSQPAGGDEQSHRGQHLVKRATKEPEGGQDPSETENGEDHQSEDCGKMDILEDRPKFPEHLGPIQTHEPDTQMDEGHSDDSKHDV